MLFLVTMVNSNKTFVPCVFELADLYWHIIKLGTPKRGTTEYGTSAEQHDTPEYNQLSLIRVRIIRTFTNSNEFSRSRQNFLTNCDRNTCITRTSLIRTFTNPNTFCWSPQRKALSNSNFLWIEKYITRILVIIVH